MLTRRDAVASSLAALTMAAVPSTGSSAAAAPGAASTGLTGQLPSCVFDWSKLAVDATAVGERRAVFDSASANMDQVECHVTTVRAGLAPHPPHKHFEEELIIVKEGTLEVMQNGETTTVGPGAVIFEASNDLHGMKNVGDGPATYFVFKWRPKVARDSE